MKPEGSRLAIVFNGSTAVYRRCRIGRERDSPLDHRERLARGHRRAADRHVLQHRHRTYIWILTNRKRKERRGKVQLINATDLFVEDAEEPRATSATNSRFGNIAEIVGIVRECRPRTADPSSLTTQISAITRSRVERPLRLAFQVTPERIEALKDESAFQKLATSKKKGKEGQHEIEAGQVLQQQIVAMLESLEGR